MTWKDPIRRGDTSPTPFGRFLFAALRVADIPFQYTLLTRTLPNLLSRYGAKPIASSSVNSLGLGLSHHQLLLLLMTTVVVVKQSHWGLAISGEALPPLDAVIVAGFHTVIKLVNNLLFTWSVTSTTTSSYVVPIPFAAGITLPLSAVVGAALFVAGIGLEWISEIQRRNFKRDPRNKGKCYTGGLFSLARHVNYGGYTIWTSGYALAVAGIGYSGFVALLFGSDFIWRGVPMLEHYCGNRYGRQWAQYETNVTWRLIPGII